MKRFIFVSFAFLAWAFYELSGGTDFQPRVATTPPASHTNVAIVTPSARADPVKATTLVASPAIAPVDAAENARPKSEPVAGLEPIRTSLNQGLPLFSGSGTTAQPLILASLEQGAAGMSAAPAPTGATPPAATPPEATKVAARPTDTREITGTRVNMRDGPGTIYPVISRLMIGHEVEVLDDSGTGWLRLRSMPEQQIGWISASLVSKAKR